jgi:lysophospholipase L1-like esterase
MTDGATLILTGCALALAAVFACAEIFLRRRRPQKRLHKPFLPYFMFGDLYLTGSLDDVEPTSTGPGWLGYVRHGWAYAWRPRRIGVRHAYEFLFDHGLSRYRLDEVDALPASALRIFIIGASVAVGSAASIREASWHAIVERSLRDIFGRPDIFVVNCAMGSFNSMHERMAYDFAVAPRRPDIVLVMNGTNDLGNPLSGVAPIHFGGAGLRYSQTWRPSIVDSLGERFEVFRLWRERRVMGAIDIEVATMLADPASREIALESVADVYVENMAWIIERALAGQSVPFLFYHPWRDLIRHRLGHPEGDCSPEVAQFMRDGLSRIVKRFESHRFKPYFHDLTVPLATQSMLDCIIDTCHPNDEGQIILAKEVLNRIAPAVKLALARKDL